MQQTRFNIFNLIHKALRSMLYEAATAIQKTDFNNREEAVATIDRLKKVLFAFDNHAEHEDKFILPAIERYNKQLVDDFESEHVIDHALAESLNEAIARWEATEDETTMKQLGSSIFYDFNEFIAFNLTHMNKEEKLLNAILWAHYSDLEILHIQQTLINSIPPEALLEGNRWMIASINNQEVIGLLMGVKNSAPGPVFGLFMKLAEEVLPEKRWQVVRGALTEGLMLAS
jgi:hemerythrin-like domain-containing protein